ncbi:MAG: DUF4765 family protein [Chloroflexi bacterium]|nr:MAG: DUF4765 family protein [Chloroflexota bacterium]
MAQNARIPAHQPDTENVVTNAQAGTTVWLWRGTTIAAANAMQAAMSAGGVPPNPGTVAPTDAQARRQVGGYSIPGFNPNDRLPEFTTNGNQGYLRVSEAIVAVAIDKQYLLKGSGSEGGWVVNRDAPIQQIQVARTGYVQQGPVPHGD